jgi:glutathione S-transferase
VRESALFFEADKRWQAEHLIMVDTRIRTRLEQLAAALGEADWLAGTFSAADIVMVHALLRFEGAHLLDSFPSIATYIDRAEDRSAYQRAFAAQHQVYRDAQGA